jgi:type III pantothenate kinase
MLLVVDVGNTNIVLGLYRGEELLRHWRLETRKGRTSDEYGMLLHHLCVLGGVELEEIDAMILSCVVPPLVEAMVGVGQSYMGLKDVMVVGHGTRTGMPIRYENPREVGADRIVNAVAAFDHVERKSGVIVCDFGTATTFDVISPKGEYLGGAIAPGVNVSLDALFHHASKLPRIELVRPKRVIGRNTVASMQSGIIYGYVGLVDGIVRRMTTELGSQPYVMATGGLAPLIAAESETIAEVVPMLTLEGLRTLWELNRTD